MLWRVILTRVWAHYGGGGGAKQARMGTFLSSNPALAGDIGRG